MKKIRYILATILIILFMNVLPLTKVNASNEQNEAPSVLDIKRNETANVKLRAEQYAIGDIVTVSDRNGNKYSFTVYGYEGNKVKLLLNGTIGTADYEGSKTAASAFGFSFNGIGRLLYAGETQYVPLEITKIGKWYWSGSGYYREGQPGGPAGGREGWFHVDENGGMTYEGLSSPDTRLVIRPVLILDVDQIKPPKPVNIILHAEHKEPSEPEKNSNSISTTPGDNYVKVWWENPGANAGWSYRLYQKGASDAEFTTVSVKYNKKVKVLNIYPRAGMNQLKTWMQNYGKNLIQVDEVLKSNFNSEPDKYLKDTNGNYKYDVLMFGTCDYNGYGEGDGDISYEASVATENFIKTGRGVLFGHDTILSYHGNFNRLLSYMKMTLRKWWWERFGSKSS